MDIRACLLEEHSLAQRDKIIAYIGNSPTRFDVLIKLFLKDEYRIVQRASWPLSSIAITHPNLIKPHLKKIVLNLKKENIHDAVKRNTVRILQHIEIPEPLQGEVMNICFGYLESPTEAVAIKAFSLTVLQRLAATYPEIIPEIKLLINDQLPHQTAAFRSRATKALKQFEKQ